MRRAMSWWVVLLLVPSALHAQTGPPVVGAPLLPNYERIPVGEREALEAGAYIARTSDANANWYNPAGLALVERTSGNLSANAYEATTLQIASLRHETNTLRLTPIGGFFGLAIGQPITSSERVRYGVFIARPIAWQTGSVDAVATLSPTSEVTLSTESNLTRMEPGIAIGVRANDRIRVGGSLGVSVTTLDQTQDLALRNADPDSASTSRRTLSVDGSAWHLVPRFGMQMDAGEQWKIGFVASAPGLQILGNSRLSLYTHGSASEDRYSDLSFLDEEADFEYKLPYSAGLGVAWNHTRGSVEATVRTYGSSDEWELLKTEQSARLVESAGGAPPTITTTPVAPIPNSWRSVTNVGIGGNYAMSESMRLHLGFNTDNSPVRDPDRSVFRKVQLVGGTAGVSYQATSFGASLGLAYSAGSSDPIPQLAGTNATLETRLKVSTFRALYSFSARF